MKLASLQLRRRQIAPTTLLTAVAGPIRVPLTFGLTGHPVAGSHTDALRAAQLLSHQRGTAVVVYHAGDGTFAIHTLGTDDADPVHIDPRRVQLIRHDAHIVSIVDGARIIDATALPFQERSELR